MSANGLHRTLWRRFARQESIRRAFVSLRPLGFKCDECYMSSALVSPHDLRTTYISLKRACFASWLEERRMLHV